MPGSCYCATRNIAFDAATEILNLSAKRPYPNVLLNDSLPLGSEEREFGMAGLN
jgi:hypothetical protein